MRCRWFWRPTGSPPERGRLINGHGESSAGTPPLPPAGRERADSGLACLLILSRYHGIAADAAQLRHQFCVPGRPLDETGFLRAAKSLGFKARRLSRGWRRLAGLPFPAVALLRDSGYAVLARVDAEAAHLHDPREPRPLALSREAFEAVWAGRLILLTTRALAAQGERRFGFSWFIPAIVKYRRVLGERHGVTFNRLLTLANMPIQRFGSMLISKGELEPYLALLRGAHREENLHSVMCRNLISVDWRGYLFDCDFNQMLDLPAQRAGHRLHLRDLLDTDVAGHPIEVAGHCFGCTAGQGSSCGGALTHAA